MKTSPEPDLFSWQPVPEFDGSTYDHAQDFTRLTKQLERVHHVLRDNQWHSLSQISALTGDPESSVSARIRDLRKPKFGGQLVQHRRNETGLWEYRLNPNPF